VERGGGWTVSDAEAWWARGCKVGNWQGG